MLSSAYAGTVLVPTVTLDNNVYRGSSASPAAQPELVEPVHAGIIIAGTCVTAAAAISMVM
jgi:hypothetical protein